MIDNIFSISAAIRYVAIYRDGLLEQQSRPDLPLASGAESDKYEELLVNPVLLTAATQRGNIDCGGMAYILVRYGHFFQCVIPTAWGHISVCIDKDDDPISIANDVMSFAGL